LSTDVPNQSAAAVMSAPRSSIDVSFCEFAREGRSVHAYNEAAFHYFLEVERERSERSQRPPLLLLANLAAAPPGTPQRLDPATARKFFTGLWLSTRETDFFGWYREGRVAGAVLTMGPRGSTDDVSKQIRDRVSEVLRQALSSSVRQRLRVGVYQLRGTPRETDASNGVHHCKQVTRLQA
jgi:hypothetical protein